MRVWIAAVLTLLLGAASAQAASTINSLPPITPFPLQDSGNPATSNQNLWISKGLTGNSDFRITPEQLGSILQSPTAPTNPYPYQYWWDTSTVPTSLRLYSGTAWVTIAQFDTAGNSWQTSSPNVGPVVGNNVQLKNSSTSVVGGLFRCGFYTEGDAPCLFYVGSAAPCTLNAGLGDDGSQVPSQDGKCWIANWQDRGRVDIRQFGAKPDDATDTAPFVQKAFQASVGIYLPGSIGIWKFSTNETYKDNHFQLTGDYPTEIQGTAACPTGKPRGTWIHLSNPAVSPFNITEGTGSTTMDSWGPQISNIGICQDHPTATNITVGASPFTYTNSTGGPVGVGVMGGTVSNVKVNGVTQPVGPNFAVPNGQSIVVTYSAAPTMNRWAPTVYPPVFNLTSVVGCHIHHIYYYGVYDGTKANNSARCTHDNIRGQVFRITWTGDHLLDVTNLTNFHIWSFWSVGNAIEPAINGYTQDNAEVILAYRADSIFIKNIFGILVKSCLHLASSLDGYGTPSAVMGDINCDAGKYSVWVTASSTYDIQLTGYLAGESQSTGSTGVRIEGASNQIFFNGLFCFFTGGSCIEDVSASGNNVVSIGTGTAFGFNQDSTGAPAFKLGNPTNPSHIKFGAVPDAYYNNTAGVYDQGNGIISVAGWYRKSFTPTLAFNGNSVGMAQTGTGSYVTNIFTNQTFGEVTITLTAKGSSTGSAIVSGPPGLNVTKSGGGIFHYYNDVNFPNRVQTLTPGGGASSIQLIQASPTSTTFLTEANFTNTSVISATFNFN